MKISQLDIWNGEVPRPGARRTVCRWGDLVLRVAAIYLDLFEASPLSRTETEILFSLFRSDGERKEPGMLAERFHVSKQTMTGLLDRLEFAGCIERLAHPNDRRRKYVHLTEKGLEVVRDLAGRALRRDARLALELPEADVARALDSLERLCARIEAWNKSNPIR